MENVSDGATGLTVVPELSFYHIHHLSLALACQYLLTRSSVLQIINLFPVLFCNPSPYNVTCCCCCVSYYFWLSVPALLVSLVSCHPAFICGFSLCVPWLHCRFVFVSLGFGISSSSSFSVLVHLGPVPSLTCRSENCLWLCWSPWIYECLSKVSLKTNGPIWRFEQDLNPHKKQICLSWSSSHTENN